jgi:hypothetical protein
LNSLMDQDTTGRLVDVTQSFLESSLSQALLKLFAGLVVSPMEIYLNTVTTRS